MVALHQVLLVSAVLFCLGAYGVLVRKNAIGMLMAIELMLNAASLNLVAFGRYKWGLIQGQVFTVFVITLAAAEAAVGLALIINVYRLRRTVNADEVDMLKW